MSICNCIGQCIRAGVCPVHGDVDPQAFIPPEIDKDDYAPEDEIGTVYEEYERYVNETEDVE